MSENKMKLEQFIGTFPNAMNDDLCFKFLKWFNEISDQRLTISTMEELGWPGTKRKDESIHMPCGLPMHYFPTGLVQSLWKILIECFNIYYTEYSIDTPMEAFNFKAHRVLPTGGYHIWHHEQGFQNYYRIVVWHLTLEAPKRGGETEFLHQSMRIEPKVGQLTIWPAGFTHKHRGNPPLEGQKTYLTGWFELISPPQQ